MKAIKSDIRYDYFWITTNEKSTFFFEKNVTFDRNDEYQEQFEAMLNDEDRRTYIRSHIKTEYEAHESAIVAALSAKGL